MVMHGMDARLAELFGGKSEPSVRTVFVTKKGNCVRSR